MLDVAVAMAAQEALDFVGPEEAHERLADAGNDTRIATARDNELLAPCADAELSIPARLASELGPIARADSAVRVRQ
jgi:hypothetical protein